MKIITLVLSFKDDPWGHIEEEGIRKTWANGAEDVLYYYGGSFPGVEDGAFSHRDGDQLFFNIPESPENIVLKTKAAFKYLLENEEFDYIYRTNTSSYVDLAMMHEVGNLLAQEHAPYAGVSKKFNHSSGHVVEFASGSGYFASHGMLADLVGAPFKWDVGFSDDATVGYIAACYDIPMTPLSRFDCIGFDSSMNPMGLEWACSRFFHFRCKSPNNRSMDVDLMHRIHAAKGKVAYVKDYVLCNFAEKNVYAKNFCFLIDKDSPRPGFMLSRWAKLSDAVARQGRSVLRSYTPGVNQFGFTAIKSFLDELEEFNTVVITYPLPEMPAVVQYLRSRGKTVILDLTETLYDFSIYSKCLNKFSAVITGHSAAVDPLTRSLNVNCLYVPTPSSSIPVSLLDKNYDHLKILFIGSDEESYKMEAVMNFAPSTYTLLRMTKGSYRTHIADPDLFMRLKIDAIVIDNTLELCIPESYLFAKGVPILACSGANSSTLLNGAGVLCHSDDEWQRAFMDIQSPSFRAKWGDAARYQYESGRFSLIKAAKTLMDIPSYSPPTWEDKPISAPKINMLIRTSSRPVQFKKLMNSIHYQNYPSLNLIVSVDNEETLNYVLKDGRASKIINVTPGEGSHFYNDYMNHLLKVVEDGWVFFMDDDDLLFDQNTLWGISSVLGDRGKLHIFQMVNESGGMAVVPPWCGGSCVVEVGSIGTPCFVLDSEIAKKGYWSSCAAADGHYITDLVKSHFREEDVVMHDLVTVRLPNGSLNGCAQNL